MFISFDRTALLTSGNLSYRYISTRAKLGTRIFVVALLKIANPHPEVSQQRLCEIAWEESGGGMG